MYVITHPKVYARLQKELDRVTVSGEIISDSEAKDLPYLQACIKEGMRVFPPVTGLFNKRVPKGGDTIHGKLIPEGTDIAYCAWDFYKDPKIFGDDAEIFRPERWLEADETKLANMQKTIDLIFGYGKYSCLGKPIALLELGKALGEVCCPRRLSHVRLRLMICQIFRRYDIELIDPLKPWKCYNRNGFFFQTEFMVRISDRVKSEPFLQRTDSKVGV
jgi:cytochrome P450